MQNPKKEWYGRGKFDPINSTFKSEIYCTTGKILPGYSKGIDTRESFDKIVVLQKWIKRLLNKGYFNPENIERIEFYLKSFLTNEDKHIFTMYPTSFKMGSDEKYSMNERLISFLNRFYSELKQQNSEINIKIDRPIKLTENQMFNTDKKFLKNEVELMEYIINKKKEGFEVGLLFGFAQKYREKYF